MPSPLGSTNRRRNLGSLLAGFTTLDRDDLSNEQQDKLRLWAEDPWAFLTGTDVHSTRTLDFPDGRPIIWTKDERDPAYPVKPFPHKGYLREIIEEIERPTLFPFDRYSTHEALKFSFVKSRQMLISTLLLLYFTHQCSFKEGHTSLVSKVTEGEACKLIRDKIRFPYRQMPRWVREELHQSPRPKEEVTFKNTDSQILGVAQNVAERESRGGTASDLLIDEAAYQDMFADILDASEPMVGRIFIVSTPIAGPPESAPGLFKSHVRMPVGALEEA